jgi:hypothetical protein
MNLITTQSNTTCIIAKPFRYENLKIAFKTQKASEKNAYRIRNLESGAGLKKA